MEYCKKNIVCKKAWSNKHQLYLSNLEEKVKRQTMLVAALKDTSGTVKEKYKNKTRFMVMQGSVASTDMTADEDQGGLSHQGKRDTILVFYMILGRRHSHPSITPPHPIKRRQ